MSNAAERIKKRFARPVTARSGDTFFVRNLTIKEHRRLDAVRDAALSDDENAIRRNGLFYALSLCDDANASPIYPQADGETDSAWSARVIEEMADIQPEVIADLLQAIQSNERLPKNDAVAKN